MITDVNVDCREKSFWPYPRIRKLEYWFVHIIRFYLSSKRPWLFESSGHSYCLVIAFYHHLSCIISYLYGTTFMPPYSTHSPLVRVLEYKQFSNQSRHEYYLQCVWIHLHKKCIISWVLIDDCNLKRALFLVWVLYHWPALTFSAIQNRLDKKWCYV